MDDKGAIKFDGLRATVYEGSHSQKVALIKHRLTHLFLPIETDLQGLREAGFPEEYGAEVAAAYAGGKAVSAVHRARGLIYDQDPDRENIEQIRNDIVGGHVPSATRAHRPEIERLWERITVLLPRHDFLLDPSVLHVLQTLEKDNACADVKAANEGREFSRWYGALDQVLEDLWCVLQDRPSSEELL